MNPRWWRRRKKSIFADIGGSTSLQSSNPVQSESYDNIVSCEGCVFVIIERVDFNCTVEKEKEEENGGGGSGSKELDECSSSNRFLCFAGAELELT